MVEKKEAKFSDGSLTRSAFIKMLKADLEANVAEVDQSDAWVLRGQGAEQQEARRRTKEVRRRTLIDRIDSATKSLVRLGQAVSEHATELGAQKISSGMGHEPSPEQRDWNSPMFGVTTLADILPKSPRKPRKSAFNPTGGYSELY